LLVALVAIATLSAGAANASAVIVTVGATTLSYQPPRASPATPAVAGAPHGSASLALEYHGGPVMPSNTNYTLYWDPSGAPAYPAGYESGLNRYFEDLAHDSGGAQNSDSVLTQYKDAAGEFANYNSHFGGALIDTAPYPANGCSSAPTCLTDAQLRAEIVRYVAEYKLPTDLQHEYFLLTPAGVESCFEAAGHSCSVGSKHAAYCSYHGHIPVTGGVIVYANDPYINGSGCDPGEEHPNNNPSDATIGGGLAHEHSESVTDPELSAWYDKRGNEVADKCATGKEATEFGVALGKAPDGAKYNQVINKDLYWYQQEWSNETGGCAQRLAASASAPTVAKLAPKKGPSAGGTSVTVTGTGFSGVLAVKFGSSAATSFKVESSTRITAVSPAEAIGTVDVTVTTGAGTSATNKNDRFKYAK
jgi:IPT/TIG domain